MLLRSWGCLLLVPSLLCTRCKPAPATGQEWPGQGTLSMSVTSAIDGVLNVEPSGLIVDPFKGQPFKEGDTLTRQLVIDIGKMHVRGSVKYVPIGAEVMFYDTGSFFRVNIVDVVIDSVRSSKFPEEFKEALKVIGTVEMNAQNIIRDTFSETSADYVMTIKDYNMDGKPDFAFESDQGHHSNYVLYFVWINMNGRLVYWNSISGLDVLPDNFTKRILHTAVNDRGRVKATFYRVVNDTTLIPITIKE